MEPVASMTAFVKAASPFGGQCTLDCSRLPHDKAWGSCVVVVSRGGQGDSRQGPEHAERSESGNWQWRRWIFKHVIDDSRKATKFSATS